jgi:hypothetical protein
MFLDNIEERELAGTPGILQTLRVALAMDVKEKVGSDSIERIEKYYLEKMLSRFEGNPGIEIYGPEDPEKRINIIPFNIKHLDRVLHPKFVTRLFSDLFGIQTRAGCSCAGPYGHRVLGISDEHSQSLIQHLQKSNLYGLKPGWVRLNLHYAFSLEEIDYLLDTIEFIIEHGALFLNDYDFDYLTGEWIPSGYKEPIIELSLDEIDSIGLKVSDDKQAGTPGLFAKQLHNASELAQVREESTCYENLEMPLEQFMFFYSKTSINKP